MKSRRIASRTGQAVRVRDLEVKHYRDQLRAAGWSEHAIPEKMDEFLSHLAAHRKQLDYDWGDYLQRRHQMIEEWRAWCEASLNFEEDV